MKITIEVDFINRRITFTDDMTSTDYDVTPVEEPFMEIDIDHITQFLNRYLMRKWDTYISIINNSEYDEKENVL